MTREEIALMRYSVTIDKISRYVARYYGRTTGIAALERPDKGGYAPVPGSCSAIEPDDMRTEAMVLVAGYARKGLLERWEKLEKPDSYVAVVLRHDLMDYAEREIRRWRREHGERPGRYATHKRLTADDKEKITAMHMQGFGSRAIARALSRERDTVRHWTRRIDRGEVIA